MSLMGATSESRNRWYDAPYAAGFARRITSCPLPALRAIGIHSRRANSLSRRRTRLRATAVFPYRGTTTPMRGRSSGEGAANTSTRDPEVRLPVRRTRRMSRPRRTRAAGGRRWPSRPVRPSLPGAPLGEESVTDGQPKPALPAPARQNFSSRPGLHPSPESVVADALPVGRLVVCGLAHQSFQELGSESSP